MRSTVVGEFCGAWYTSGAPSPWSVWGVCLTACSSFFCLHWSVGGRYFTACLVSLLFALVSMGSVLSCLFSLSFVCIGQCGEESVCSTGATHFSFRCPDSSSSSQITWQASTTIVWPYASTLSSLCYDRREHMLAFHQPVPVHKMSDLKSRRLELILFIRFRKQEVQDFRLPVPTYLKRGVGQNHIYKSYMTVYLVISLQKCCICTVHIWFWPTLLKQA